MFHRETCAVDDVPPPSTHRFHLHSQFKGNFSIVGHPMACFRGKSRSYIWGINSTENGGWQIIKRNKLATNSQCHQKIARMTQCSWHSHLHFVTHPQVQPCVELRDLSIFGMVLLKSSWIIQWLVLEILLKPNVAIEKSSMASLIWLFPAKKAFISSKEISCGDCPASDYPRVTNRLILKMAVYSWFTYSI